MPRPRCRQGWSGWRFTCWRKRHPEPGEDGPPLTLVCSDIHLEMEGYSVEQGAVIEIPLLPPGARGRLAGATT
jgi:hypothetical protein